MKVPYILIVICRRRCLKVVSLFIDHHFPDDLSHNNGFVKTSNKTTFKYRLLHITINIYGTFIIRGSFFVSSQILPHDEGAFLYPRKMQPHSEGAFLYLSMNDCINKNSQALKCYDLSQTHCSQSEPE